MQPAVANRNITNILVLIAACIVIVAGMRTASPILVPFFLATFIAIITGPFMSWLVRRGVPRAIALVLVIGAVVIAVVVIAGLIGSSLKRFSADWGCSKATVHNLKITQ